MKESLNCPHCGASIDIDGLLYAKFQDSLKQKELELESFKAKLEATNKQALDDEKRRLSQEIKAELNEQNSAALKLLNDELEQKSAQLKELNKTKAELESLKRAKDELASQLQAKANAELNKQLNIERDRLKQSLSAEYELNIKQYELQLSQLRDQLSAAQQKALSSSQQLVGESQEILIQEYLKASFVLDEIEPIKQGARGADCLQIVHTKSLQNCGKIYFESKRTKEFSPAWVEKLKADMRQIGADIGVIVTQALPKEIERVGVINGVWICGFSEFKWLSFVLRDSLIKLHIAKKQDENKSDKMALLYSYLTSKEFGMQIESILESFSAMQSELESEKRAMARIWKQREKQIQNVLSSTIDMYGALRGIAGASIAKVKALELENLTKDYDDINN